MNDSPDKILLSHTKRIGNVSSRNIDQNLHHEVLVGFKKVTKKNSSQVKLMVFKIAIQNMKCDRLERDI